MDKSLTRETSIVYRQLKIIKNNLDIDIDLLFAKPELMPGGEYTCVFNIVSSTGKTISDKGSGYDSLQAVELAIFRVFDLLDIYIDEIVTGIQK